MYRVALNWYRKQVHTKESEKIIRVFKFFILPGTAEVPACQLSFLGAVLAVDEKAAVPVADMALACR
jgi:hypothetical protein